MLYPENNVLVKRVSTREYRLRRNGALGLAASCALFALWFGEGTAPLRDALPLAGGITGSLVVALVVPGSGKSRALAGIASLTLYAAAFFIGLESFGRAFDECMDKGEEVRLLLSEYHDRTNKYPESLKDVGGDRFCERVLRPTILEYERTNGGYHLSFRDWLVEHAATESESFLAHK